MSERDSEIDFDFFEEPEPEEQEPRSRSPLRRGPRGPRRPPPAANIAPLVRLVALVVGAIVVVVVLVFVVDRCRGSGKEAAYEDYMGKVQPVATDSEAVGRAFTSLLTQPGIKQADVEDRLDGLATREHQALQRAQDIDPPGALRTQHEHLLEALQLRESGLRGMAAAFRETTNVDNPREAAELLADQARRFVASDVVWDDLFKDPSARELEDRGVRGVAVPDSNFLEDPNLATIAQLRPIWRRIKGATEGIPKNARRGNGIESLTALPEGTQLTPDELSLVKASTQLAFRVAVKNSGEVQEVRVPVTLTIQKSPTSIVKRTVIEAINPGQTISVTFSNIGDVPIGPETSITVEVKPVENEANAENNTFTYPVHFTI
jgi:hypothetical protein